VIMAVALLIVMASLITKFAGDRRDAAAPL